MDWPVTKGLRPAERVNQRSGFSLPDDLVIYFLSSLPVEDVLRCRQVCRGLRDLTSTKYFVDQHSRRSAPVILATVADGLTCNFLPYMLSRWWEPIPTESLIRKLNKWPGGVPGYGTCCSGHGLLVLRCSFDFRKFIVFNPVYSKLVTIVLPGRLSGRADPFAIYFHPTFKEYCILWEVQWSRYPQPWEQKGNEYMILVLGSKPHWRKIRNSWIHEVKKYSDSSPVFLGQYLYWLVKPIAVEDNEYSAKFDIMEFDILSEEMKVIPSPVSHAVKDNGYNKDLLNDPNMSLLDIGGLLSLFLIGTISSRLQVYQWTLISRAEESWTSYIYNVNEDLIRCSPVRALALVDEFLLIEDSELLVINLKLGTTRELGFHYCPSSPLLFHLITLASLMNCQSKIIIDDISMEAKDEEHVMSIGNAVEENVTRAQA